MLHIQKSGWRISAKVGQRGVLLVLAAVTGSVMIGCGSGAKTSASQGTTTGTQGTTTGTQGTVGGEVGGVISPQINGIATTSDASVSANGKPVPVGGATIVVENASGVKVAQAQTAPDGTYDILVPDGMYTVVPSPFAVGSVTLTAPPQQVTVKTVNYNGEQNVPITYTRPQ